LSRVKKLSEPRFFSFPQALGFSLKAKPSDVAFHFKRLLRVLEWDPRSYLGSEFMYRQWQDSLMEESRHNERRKVRRERRTKKNERKLLKLQRKLHIKQAKMGEELPGRSGRRASTDKGFDRNANVMFRRNTAEAAVHPYPDSSDMAVHPTLGASHFSGSYARLLQTGANYYTANGSPGRQSPNPKKAEGAAIRGILTRLRMQPSQTPLKLSGSSPNLPSLASKLNDFVEINVGDEDILCIPSQKGVD
jgi:hypothetical protein